MPITIKLPTPLRRHAGGAKTAQVEAATAGEALQQLVATYPAMEGSIYDDAGEVRGFVRVFVDGTDMADLDGPATALGDDAEIAIVPPVAGA